MLFAKMDKVDIVSTFYGNACSFVGMSGVVTDAENGWVHVQVDGEDDKEPVPFRERELKLSN